MSIVSEDIVTSWHGNMRSWENVIFVEEVTWFGRAVSSVSVTIFIDDLSSAFILCVEIIANIITHLDKHVVCISLLLSHALDIAPPRAVLLLTLAHLLFFPDIDL